MIVSVLGIEGFDNLVEKAAKTAFSHANGTLGKVNILLTDDAEIQALNLKYRGIDKPTNVLSFDTGDIAISLDTVKAEAPDMFDEHLAHMVVHGVLHLLGFDHIIDGDAEIMESLEAEILKEMNIENPYE